ncbi:MAG: hypothetical protein ACK5LG_21850 [Bacteroides thetaiotaomicron]
MNNLRKEKKWNPDGAVMMVSQEDVNVIIMLSGKRAYPETVAAIIKAETGRTFRDVTVKAINKMMGK